MSNTPPVLILAGGKGTRLQSVVADVPKPLATVAGKPFLRWHLEHVVQQGLKEVVVSAGYLASSFDAFLKEQKDLSLDIEIVIEHELLGTGGAVKYAVSQSKILGGNELFLCLNGDSFTPWSASDLLSAADSREGSLLALEVEDPLRYGTLSFRNQDSELNSFEEKTPSPASAFINGGIYVFRRTLFESIPKGKRSLEYDLFPLWLSDGCTFGIVKASTAFIDIGTPDSYQLAQTFFETSPTS